MVDIRDAYLGLKISTLVDIMFLPIKNKQKYLVIKMGNAHRVKNERANVQNNKRIKKMKNKSQYCLLGAIKI